MAKVRPILPGRRPNTPEDRRPDQDHPRPDERNDVFKEIGQLIVNEWRNAVRDGRALNRDHLETAITPHLRLDEQGAPVEIGIIVDPKPEPGRKFVWIVIPYPDAPQGYTTQQWVEVYEGDNDLKTLLGEAVLFGCGR